MLSPLARALAHLFDYDVVLERIPEGSGDFEPFELPPDASPLRGHYSPKPATSVNSSQMFSTAAIAVDSLLLNQAVHEINAGWRVRIHKQTASGPLSKYFRVDDGAVNAQGFTLLTLKDNVTKDTAAAPTATLPITPPPRKFS